MTGLTISKEQLSEATARVRALGLEDRVTLMFCDYRHCPGAPWDEHLASTSLTSYLLHLPLAGQGTYDKVVSIEMIEAVGHAGEGGEGERHL